MTCSATMAAGVLSGVALSMFAPTALSQSFPSKAIRIIVPLAPDGPGDVFARAIGQKLSEYAGRPVVIDNRPGANTNVGTQAVAKAAPDGYTLLVTASALTINPSLYRGLSYDPIRDFAPITLIAMTPLVLVSHPSLPVKSVKELVALAKSKPGQLLYGSDGNGGPSHLAGEMFNTLANVKLAHLPYQGVTNAVSNLLRGQIPLMFLGMAVGLPQARAGRLRALATTGEKRSRAAPELPTIAEAGLPGYEASVWYGALAPAGTPFAAINRLHVEIRKIVQLPEIKERWAVLAAEPTHNTPEQFAAFLKADLVKWTKVVRDSGAQID